MITPTFKQPKPPLRTTLACVFILALSGAAGIAQGQSLTPARLSTPAIEEVLHTASPEYLQAQSFMEQGDYASATRLLTPLAARGEAQAQSQLGELYLQGRGVPQNIPKAFDLFKQAAGQGHAPAMYALGLLYETAQAPGPSELTQLLMTVLKGKPRDLTQEAQEKRKNDMQSALQWYTQAAENGNEDAMRALTRLYQGADKGWADAQKAFRWTAALAERGDAGAQFDMGKAYSSGQGVAQNHALALSWYMRAQEQGHAAAMNRIGDLYYNGQGTAKDLAHAREWYQKAAALNDADAQDNLGWLAWRGEGTKKDLKQADSWFSTAATNGHSSASAHLRELRQEIANQEIKRQLELQQTRDKARGYRHATFKDYLLDAPEAKLDTGFVVAGFYHLSGNVESMVETLTATQIPNAPRIYLLTESAPREARRQLLELRSSPCGMAGICRLVVLGKTSQCEIMLMGRRVQVTTCLAVDEVRPAY